MIILRGIRRKEKAINDLNEIKDILKQTKHITFAMSKLNIPYLVTVSHGYDMDKNCPYQLMTTDVYIIGYHIPISDGDVFRYPIFESKYAKKKMEVLASLKKKSTMNTLYTCGFPLLVVQNIMKYLH